MSQLQLLPPAYVVRGKVMFWHLSVYLSTLSGGGWVPGPGPGREGPRSQIFGGIPGLRFSGGSQVSDFWGGPRSQIFRGGPWFLGVGRGVPGLSKGKNFLTPDLAWYMFRLEKKIFVKGPSPPPSPVRNSKKLLWLRGGRYASCVHAGGLSCLDIIIACYSSQTNLGKSHCNSLAIMERINHICVYWTPTLWHRRYSDVYADQGATQFLRTS